MSDREATRGIYRKYYVERIDDQEHKHDNCAYFVLDLVHDEFARPALKAYAKACKTKFPKLAKDLTHALKLSSGPEGKFFSRASLGSVLKMKMDDPR